EDDEVFACPMAVCSADLDEQEFTIVFQVRGPKTAFLAGEGDQLAVKGPYRAGLFGVRRLYGAADQRVLIIVSSTGQSLVPAIVRQLTLADNDIRIVLDPGSGGGLYILDYLREWEGPVLAARLYDAQAREELGPLRELIRDSDCDLIITLGSDSLHRRAARWIRPEQGWVASNNSVMVCADGVCGSCSIVLRDGREVRGCKVDIAPEDVFWRAADRPAAEGEG
ncbi:MAG: hypothetical protein R6U70_01440, partial [Bacillota bacterium]